VNGGIELQTKQPSLSKVGFFLILLNFPTVLLELSSHLYSYLVDFCTAQA